MNLLYIEGEVSASYERGALYLELGNLSLEQQPTANPVEGYLSYVSDAASGFWAMAPPPPH